MAMTTDRKFIASILLEFDRMTLEGSAYAALANIIRDVCPSERPEKYTSLGSELAGLAASFGISDLKFETTGSNKSRAGVIAAHLKDLARGRKRALAGPLLLWLWQSHSTAARDLLERLGIDHAATLARARATAGQSTVTSHRQDQQPFSLESMLETAKSRLILVAQNHWHMISQPTTSASDYWPKIAACLKRGVTIDIIAMHPDALPPLPSENAPDAIGVWAQYSKSPAFRAHVERCWRTLGSFAKSYKELSLDGRDASLPLGQLNLYRAYFVPLTISAIDPLEEFGTIVISPRTSSETSGTRPKFVITRTGNPEDFLYYWHFVENGMANQGWESIEIE